MKQIGLKVISWWFDLFTPWRRNTLHFFINERGDLELISDDDSYNFEVSEIEEIADRVLTTFPSGEFSTWLRANVGGLKMSRTYSIDYEVSPSGKLRFDLDSFNASSWAMKVV